ncbi:hypothetical protein HELRODRAFT_172550 [Helobdella robusta]|uniref:Uncharacterized protein n=1 Tax=Helobdella robusta TaxID=6412 RepID=T1F5I1_HELRO|nr:hypothetical protein HELRODRAFT_172550 [Helobdella robusta]ESO04202.1 hypothetical protein HELRODRAFT_172550 [Helobdella robusta]
MEKRHKRRVAARNNRMLIKKMQQIKSEEFTKSVDEWIQRIAEKEAMAKNEIQMKHSADLTLAEVKKKIMEMKKNLKLLNLLKSLKDIRVSKVKGMMELDKSNTFYQRVENLKVFLNNQLVVYGHEQKTLEVMLKTEQALDSKRNQKIINAAVINESDEYKRCLNSYLFGETQSENNLFSGYYELPSRDACSFLHIRHQWDQYLDAADGSKIPTSWVTPCEPSSLQWQSALL